MLAPEQRPVIGKIPVTKRHREVYGEAFEIVVFIVFATHPPRLAADNAVEFLHRTYHRGGQLAQQTVEAALAVIKQDIAYAVGNLTNADASKRCRHEVVDGRRFYLA